ncbi:MAG: hypothetical protein K0S65_2154 [Labilithrix sp.]|nr:hypothetical protein [Labilithrix sp.]
MVSLRSFVAGLVVATAGLSATGCAGVHQDFQREFTPGQLQSGSRVHAFQAASFAYAFTQGHMTGYEARLERLEDDVPAFFEALDRAGWRAELSVVGHTNRGDKMEYEYYDVDLVLVPKDPKAKERFVLPGAEGTRSTAYVAALGPAAKKTGIPSEVIRRGHFALFGIATLSGALNASDDSMKRYAFGLLVLKEKLKAGERADYLAPLRPANESLEDIEVALRVIADHHRESARMRAEVIGLTALARVADDAKARATLVEQAVESRKAARAWLDSHERPTTQEFGVAMKELKLPTPENMLAVLDKDGYITAAVQVAKGVAAGDPSATVEGLGKLAPKGSSLRIASEGVGAALRGDVGKAADCALQLAERQEDIAPLAARLRAVEQTVTAARNTAKGVAATVDSIPKSPSELAERAKNATKATAKKAADAAVKQATDAAVKKAQDNR